MTVAFRDHLQWGSQVVWTYGPYGYMNEPAFMDFSTWAWAFLANMAGHVAFFGLLALFLWRIKARPWLWVLMSVVIVLSFDRYTGQVFERFPVLDHKAALVAVLLLYLAGETDRKSAAFFAGAAGLVIGYLFLDKGTFVLIGGSLALIHVAISLTTGRVASAVSLLGGLVAGFLGLWLLAGQSIEGIPGYFRSLFEITAGYTPAMSWFLETGVAHPTLQLGIAVAMVAATGVLLLATLRRRDWSGFRLLLLTSPLLFFVFKNSFVRFSEPRALAFWALVAVLQSLVLVRAIAATGTNRSATTSIASVTVLACVALVGGFAASIGGLPDTQNFAFPKNLPGYDHAASLFVRPDLRVAEEAQVISALRDAYPLPPDVIDELRNGTVDVVPFDLQLVFAYGFQWDPQPVLQSYSAYRPYLDHFDAQHYLGPGAPRFVVYDPTKTIDGRYPLFDEPETYRVLFARYRVLERISDLIVLERRPDAPLPTERQLSKVTGPLGEWIAVPPHGDQRLFGRVEVDYSLLGLALHVLHRPPELHIRIRYGGGEVSPSYRFVAAVAPDGLELSGYAPDSASVEQLMAGQFDQPLEAIQIVADWPVEAYEQQVVVTYFTQTT
jgi:hypothetical protein